MKKTFLLLTIAALSLTACKTTEANYRAAYEMALQKDKEGIDEDTYALIKQEEAPHEIDSDGDKLRMITQSVIVTKNAGNDAATIRRFNVAIGSFRQVFNAKAMRGRIIDKGYDVFIVETSEPTYYVIAAACDTIEQAKEVIERLQADESIVLRHPYPCILQPSRY
jgi:cell division protein FtsN